MTTSQRSLCSSSTGKTDMQSNRETWESGINSRRLASASGESPINGSCAKEKNWHWCFSIPSEEHRVCSGEKAREKVLGSSWSLFVWRRQWEDNWRTHIHIHVHQRQKILPRPEPSGQAASVSRISPHPSVMVKSLTQTLHGGNWGVAAGGAQRHTGETQGFYKSHVTLPCQTAGPKHLLANTDAVSGAYTCAVPREINTCILPEEKRGKEGVTLVGK